MSSAAQNELPVFPDDVPGLEVLAEVHERLVSEEVVYVRGEDLKRSVEIGRNLAHTILVSEVSALPLDEDQQYLLERSRMLQKTLPTRLEAAR
jgi:hypothetical protein